MPSEAVPVSNFQKTKALFERERDETDSTPQPLRINKSTPTTTSPSKFNGTQRALAEISPMERRRNSPSYNQATKKMILTRDSTSPFDSSPYGNSSRTFWQGREPTTSPSRFTSENPFEREQSPSAAKRRTSIEKLMQASRVKNSAMFARELKNEYDPASVAAVERPLAAGRPLSTQVQGNAFGGRGIEGQRESTGFRGHKRGESQSKVPLFSPSMASPNSTASAEKSPSPMLSRDQPSPSKSSMSNNPNHNTFPRRFDPNVAGFDDDDEEVTIEPPRALRRQAKSVTFDTAPPEVNEYEMQTPDPSSVASGSREGSYEIDEDEDEMIDLDQAEVDREDSFDASLEDTDKTPVVLPEDWRHMSPEVANTSLAATFEDPFDPDQIGLTPSKAQGSGTRRTDSLNSDGSHRPLPALPNGSPRRESNGLSAAAERVHSAHRSLPSPPRGAQISKSDILGMKHSKMSLEERLRLMGISDSTNDAAPQGSAAKEAARLRKHGLGIHLQDDESDSVGDPPFPRISRESILRKVKSRSIENLHERRYDVANLDPDVPIPSREGSETSSHFDEIPSDIPIKQEEDDEPIDVYSIPELYSVEPEEAHENQLARNGSVIRHNLDAESYYSPEAAVADAQQTSNSSTEDEGPPTPKGNSPLRANAQADKDGANLPELSSLLDDADFQAGLGSYMSQSSTPPPPPIAKDTPVKNMQSVHRFFQRGTTPEEHARPLSAPEHNHADDRSGTPDSVIHHSIDEEESEQEISFVPEPVATIKAPGGKLKARPSATPADMASMAAARRQVSGQMPPPIPEKSPRRYSKSLEPEDADKESSDLSEEARQKRRETFSNMKLDLAEEALGEDLSLGLEKDFERVIESSKVHLYSSFPAFAQQDNVIGTIDARDVVHLTVGGPCAEHLCGAPFSPHKQQSSTTNASFRTQKGYLMRQNTKVVVAKRNFSNETSSDGRPSSAHEIGSTSRSAPSSPRKPSHERAKSWTTEPWNGKIRRKSVRTGSGAKKSGMGGVIPPLPGQESVVSGGGLEAIGEDKQAQFGDEEQEEGVERGRLFVKVVGVKELDLPLSQNEPTWFRLTLDNGLHCVTTSWLELGHTAPIGQEFELVVLNDLEFQLTLQTKITPPPKPMATNTHSLFKSSTSSKSPTKKTSFRSLFSSPTKRREQERLAQQKAAEEEAQRVAEQERAASRAAATSGPTAWDLLHELVGEDGSFGRAYVCLKSHERSCYGRQITVDMPVFNEWAMEDASISSSVKSKSGGAVLRRPPYEVGKLTLQLLYVPRPRGSAEEDMPKSMNGALREMAAAEESQGTAWEGFLSQQGGDCPYWRRRFFRLNGTKLTAFHEMTRQPRAGIDLSKAIKLIDDKTSLVQPDPHSSSSSNGNSSGGGRKARRKSAFAEEEEGYMFVEEGFRIRFGNGEVIDFYADNTTEKEEWMVVLAKVVGRDNGGAGGKGGKKRWCEMVLAKEQLQGSAESFGSKKDKAVAALAAAAEKSQQSSAGATNGRSHQQMDRHLAPPPRTSSAVPRSAPQSPVKQTSPVKPHREAPMAPMMSGALNHGGRVSPAMPAMRQPNPRMNGRRQQVKSMLF